MYKIIVPQKIDESGVSLMRQYCEVDYFQGEITTGQLTEIIHKYDAILTRVPYKISKELIEKGKKLKAIGTNGVGLNNIDVSYAKEKNIPVINAPGLSSDAVSEIAIAHIISLFRHYYKAVNTVKNGLWEKNNLVGKTLSKKTLGVVSYGKVGKKVALFGKIMDMEVLVYDPYIEENIIAEIGAKKVELNHLLSHSDIISIHSPLTPETEKMLNHRTMCTLKKGVYIVNVGRGALIDEDALYENIINGKIAGVGLDVMALEPHPQNNKLIKLDSVLVTPHIGGSTYESQKTISLHVANGILKALNCL